MIVFVIFFMAKSPNFYFLDLDPQIADIWNKAKKQYL